MSIGRAALVRVIKATFTASVMTLLAFAGPAPAQAAAATGAGQSVAGTAGTSLALLDMVVLVDESGSETAQKIADEKQAVATVVQSMLNPNSVVTVIGFGGVNHFAPNQTPVNVVCQPTIAGGAANLGYLASCVGALHRRSEAEGDDTDYAAALAAAMNYLSPAGTAAPTAPSGASKVILMMTDGSVNVSRDSQQYGTDWQLGERLAISQQLAAATSAGVQLWPLGFGTDIGGGITQTQAAQYLNMMAAGAAPAACDTQSAANRPHATWVNDPVDAITVLGQVYADAACLGTSEAQGAVAGGASSTLVVDVPAIASGAAISVDRANPAITVTFTRPNGTQWTDSSATSGVSGGSTVEVLHLASITAADAGPWKVTLTAPAGLAGAPVSAVAFWQGAVRAIITTDPVNAKPGQPIGVTLSVLGPNGPLTDPGTLRSLQAGVTVTGDGLPAPEQLPVGASQAAGVYRGTFTAPAGRSGTLTFTGTVAGYGLYATQFPATATIGNAAAGFTASPLFPPATSVQAGTGVTGQVSFTNTTGISRQVRLVLDTSGAAAAISPGGPILVPAGNPPRIPFAVTVDRSSSAGAAWFRVEVVDATTGQLYNEATLNVNVTIPAAWYSTYWWAIVVIIVLLALLILAALWWLRVIRARRDARGLVAILRLGGVPAGPELSATGKYAEVFPFVIRDETSPAPRLDHPTTGAGIPVYRVRRARRGVVTLATPVGLRAEVEVGGAGQILGNGLELAFRDTRHPDWTGSPGPARSASWTGSPESAPPASAPGSSPAPDYEPGDWAGPAAIPYPSTPYQPSRPPDDDWL
jgi:von Willebrand factor type A domain